MAAKASLLSDLEASLGGGLPAELTRDLINDYLALRQDVATATFGRTSAGKFVETAVQALQFLEIGAYEPNPKVDEYLRGVDSRQSSLDDGLRICVARIARAMYALRNKRGLAHKGQVDPNAFDLLFLLQGAQWILSEFVRHLAHTTVEAAGALVARIQQPAGGLVEDFGHRKLVLVDASVREQILLILQSHYPAAIAVSDLIASVDRSSPKTVRNNIRNLWLGRLIEGNGTKGYLLTATGAREAVRVASKYATV